MNNCLNCNRPLLEGQKFCAFCGQKTALKRLSLFEIWHDVVHYFTHADKGIFQLLKALIVQNGTVAKEFVAGKRKKYFPPLNFFLIVAALYVFMNGILSHSGIPAKPGNASYSYRTQQNKTASPAVQQESDRKVVLASRFLAKYSNFVAMFAAPFISLFIWLVYFRGPYHFTEHLVANLYLIGFTNLVRCMIYSPLLFLFHIHPGNRWANFLIVLFEISYRTIFYYRFMGNFSTAGKVKSFGLAIATLVAWWLLIYVFIFLFAQLS